MLPGLARCRDCTCFFSAVLDGFSVTSTKTFNTASEREPLHVPALGASQRDDVLAREHLERGRVDPLLVDENEGLSVLLCAHLPLQLDDFSHLLVGVSPLGLDQLIALLSAAVVEPGVHLSGEARIPELTPGCFHHWNKLAIATQLSQLWDQNDSTQVEPTQIEPLQ